MLFRGRKIYLTNVPQYFLKIKSELSDINPNCITLVPLINEDLNEIKGLMKTIRAFKKSVGDANQASEDSEE